MRIGIGYDVHRLVSNRKLILGGVEIAYEKGLEGHSDADVLVHAIMDALLGALALGSIGDHFPDSDPGYKNADSLKLLEQVLQLVDQKGYQVGNVDSVLICQSPKLKNYISAMRQNIANCLRTDPDNIAVKATTTEQLGFEGKGQGIAAQAVVMLQSKC